MTRAYSDRFFSYIERGSLRSARTVIPIVQDLLEVKSVVDVGCGRGAWLSVWREHGAARVFGIDGEYVNQDSLLVGPDEFLGADLASPLRVSERFSLAQCLEVAEHLPPESSGEIVRSLANLSDVVLFSAAVPGQGGEHHVNEREPEYWRLLFAKLGYAAFDVVRPKLAAEYSVEPWYRYNTVLYANPAGQSRLSDSIVGQRVPDGVPIKRMGNAAWKLRLTLVRLMPVAMATSLAQLKARARTILH